MDSQFQAKDIQRIVGISKSRYEYLASKLNIAPEVEEVMGTGYTHLYSFENLMFFAMGHRLNKLGLGPKSVRRVLGRLHSSPYRFKFFEPFVPSNFVDWKLHLAKLNKAEYIMVDSAILLPWRDSGPNRNPLGTLGRKLDKRETALEKLITPENQREYLSKLFKTVYGEEQGASLWEWYLPIFNVFGPSAERVNAFVVDCKESKEAFLNQCDGYVTLNVGKIKHRILAEIKG
jgi:hypothetical protein